MSDQETMNTRQREAVIAKLAIELRDRGSWCGETHVQKASYLLENLTEVPLGFGHILYKFGPFAFDLRDELEVMQADGFLESEAVQGYGPRLKVTEAANDQLLKKWPKTTARYEPQISFVAGKVGDAGVGQLERLATALWIQEEDPDAGLEFWSARLNEVKPHISLEDSTKALVTINSWRDEAGKLAA